jgi:selenium metabolism protein YedF
MPEPITIDARGLACPQPVLETKKALEDHLSARFTVIVDNDAARENVSRFARNQGCEVEVEDGGANQFQITIKRSEATPAVTREEVRAASVADDTPGDLKTVVYISSCSMGRGDEDLGTKLMRGFLRTWIDSRPMPWRMIFINSGVRLTTVDEEAVEAVSLLEEKGVEILSCGTCLDHFGLKDELRSGRVTNMYEVIDSLNAASKVISPD